MGLEDRVRDLRRDQREEKEEHGSGGGHRERRWTVNMWPGETGSNEGHYGWEVS